MSPLRGGPKWRVTKRHPKAFALKQQTGEWKVFTDATCKHCLGEGRGPGPAWTNAARNIK